MVPDVHWWFVDEADMVFKEGTIQGGGQGMAKEEQAGSQAGK